MDFARDAADYDSCFEDDTLPTRVDPEVLARREKKEKRQDLATKSSLPKAPKASKAQFSEEVTRDEGRRQRFQLLSLNAYDRHKKLINDYYLYFPGATKKLQRDTSKDKTDLDVIRENHRFLWDSKEEQEEELTWGQNLAKRYYEKLFKEYCICDLSRYKENKVAMRWRTETEVKDGKGQFMCGARKCTEHERLRTWEVNFAYLEEGEKKNALVKVRLCPDCSYKLNYFHKKKEVIRNRRKKETTDRKKRRRSQKDGRKSDEESDEDIVAKARREQEDKVNEAKAAKQASEIWSAPLEIEQEKSREEDFSEYLEDLFL